MPPEMISHYRLAGPLGEGGMGVVYKAEDTRLGRLVALKILNAQHSDRFEKEARAIAALNHPNICTLYDVGQYEGQPFLVMEFVEGKPAATPLPLEQALACARQVAEGLAAAHAKRMIHRDLKPANVMVTPGGRVKLLDFGLAKLIAVAGADEATQSAVGMTAEGVVAGTVAYMSPEQAQGKPLDVRSDVFAFGVLMYEMLTGIQPFRRGSDISTLAAILQEEPAPLTAGLPGTPPALQRLVTRCLAKDREERYASAAGLADELAAISRSLEPAPSSRRRPIAMAAALTAILAVAGTAAWMGWRAYLVRDAHNRVLPEIERLADGGNYAGAMALAREVEPIIGGDAAFRRWLSNISYLTTVTTDPAGALASWKPYHAPESAWQRLGETPIEDLRMPRGLLRWRFEKPGYEPVEVARGTPGQISSYAVASRLHASGSVPPGMVWVAGGSVSQGAAGPVSVKGFWIDRHEVSNREFKAFVDRGGYRDKTFWTVPVRDGEAEVALEAALAGFVDSTGRPGPAAWELGAWREGMADHPAAGVSWYEAAAYCESVGKSLPTFFHWHKAATAGATPNVLAFAAFGTSGTVARGSRPSLMVSGAYDMAGNVKEWVVNESGSRRAILGGAWDEVTYMFTSLDAHPPLARRESFGFRCAKYPEPPDAAAAAPLPVITRDFTRERPVDDETFRILKGMYSYERTDLAASVDAVETSNQHFRREKVSFAAAYGAERVIAYLFLPSNASPPYQAVVYFPGSGAFTDRHIDLIDLSVIDFVVRSGRAVLFPAYKGSFDRFIDGAPYTALAPAALRDNLIQWSKDLSRSIDYLATRPDIDSSRLAYEGFSLGGCDALVCVALEPRFKTAVLIAGGLHGDHRYVPEDDPVNFVPRIRMPVLLVGGRDDFVHPLESAQKSLMRMLGTPEADKRHVILDAGHVPPRGLYMRVVLDWLDRYLGPVRTGG